jgi:hypothetical protein
MLIGDPFTTDTDTETHTQNTEARNATEQQQENHEKQIKKGGKEKQWMIFVVRPILKSKNCHHPPTRCRLPRHEWAPPRMKILIFLRGNSGPWTFSLSNAAAFLNFGG